MSQFDNVDLNEIRALTDTTPQKAEPVVAAGVKKPSAKPSQFDSVDMDEIRSLTGSTAPGTLSEAMKVPPEQGAKELKLKKSTGLTLQSIRGNRPRIEHAEAVKMLNIPEMMRKNPATHEILTNYDSAMVVHDEVPAMMKAEDAILGKGYVDHLTESFQRGQDIVRESEIGMGRLWKHLGVNELGVTDQDMADLADIQKRRDTVTNTGFNNEEIISKNGEPNYNWLQESPIVASEMLPIMGNILAEGLKGTAIGGSIGLGVGAVTGPGAVATGIAGAKLGGRAGVAIGAFNLEAGLAFNEFVEMTDNKQHVVPLPDTPAPEPARDYSEPLDPTRLSTENLDPDFVKGMRQGGRKLDPDLAATGAIVVGGINAALEMVTLRALGRTVTPVMRRIIRTKVKQALGTQTGREIARQIAGRYLTAVGTEGVVEGLQETSNIVTGEFMQLFDDGAFTEETLSSTLDDIFEQAPRALEAANKGAQAAVTIGLPSTVVSSAVAYQDQRAKQAGKAQVHLDLVNDALSQLSVRERSDDVFKQFVEKADAGQNTTVFIDGPQTALYLQTKTPEEINADPGLKLLAAQVREAATLGGEIQVPIADFGVALAGTDHFTALREHMTTDASLPTPFRLANDAVEFENQIKGIIAEKEQQSVQYVESQRIYETVRDQLIDTGQVDPQYARVMSEVVPAYFAALSERTGIPVAKLYADRGFRVEGPQTGRLDALRPEISPEEIQSRVAPATDRRAASETVQTDNRQSDRRVDTQRRAAFDAMSPDEKYDALYRNELTGINNRRAFSEDTGKYPAIASIDADSLKAVNDSLGHNAGDEMLKLIAAALHESSGGKAYHVSGDEFYVAGASPAEIQSAIEKAQASLQSQSVASESGTLTGPRLSFGIGTDKASADKAMENAKKEREAAGERTPRGELPGNITLKDTAIVDEFYKALIKAKADNKNGASVVIWPKEDYAKMDLFLYDDGKAGFAITRQGDLVSVFKHPDSTIEGAMGVMVPEAIRNGVRRLDAFEGPLTEGYAKYGFVEVGRETFNPEIAPEGWDIETMGTPDVVFMEISNEEAAKQSETESVQKPERVRRGTRLLEQQSGQDQGDGRESDGSLQGLPRNIEGFEPKHNSVIEGVAREYMEKAGLEYTPPNMYAPVDPVRAERIAAAFEAMEHNPSDPAVKAAYQQMIDETVAQYEAILETGFVAEFITETDAEGSLIDPYAATPRLVIDDINDNNHMWVFSTKDGFGSDETFDPLDNPLLQDTKFKDANGVPMLANDVFRVVHDYFGHAKEGVGFRAAGEENAWRAHWAMYSPEARKALTSETRGQNSWLNYGPYGETNRTAKVEDTHFADQKIGLLPDWAVNDGAQDEVFNQPAYDNAAEVYDAVRDNFLNNLDIESGFDEVLDAEHWSPQERQFLKALDSNDWLGFDNPAGAIEAALSGDINNWEPSQSLKAAIGKLVNNQGVLFYQAVSLRKGTETLKRFGLHPDKTHKTRDIAAALEARQRSKHGHIPKDDRSPGTSSKIAKWMVEEVLFEMETPEKSGAGWYSEKFQRALDIFGEEFPELKTDDSARNLMTSLIAITSDGQKVVPNFAMAVDIYRNYKKTGKLSTSRGHTRQASININIKNIQNLLDEMGPVEMHNHLMEELTVSELNKLAKEKGVDFSTDYKADVTLPRAAIVFGPKLGAFYANLMGSHGYLTMDRWWTRTFNRYRGSLLQNVSGSGENTTDSKGRKIGLARFKEMIGEPNISDDEALSKTVEHRNSYEKKNYKNGTDVERAANTLYKQAFENIEDAPYNASDRSFMLEAVNKAQKNLKRRGKDVSIADIQAMLWYYEKRLYGDLGARQSADISYEEAAKRVVGTTGGRLAQGGLDEVVPVGEEIFNAEGQENSQVNGYYDPANSLIRLTESANLSTFLHEFAHFMYEMELKHDGEYLPAINKWLTRHSDKIAKEANRYLGTGGNVLEQSKQAAEAAGFDTSQVFYHGSQAANIEAFTPGRAGTTFFSVDEGYSKQYGKNVYPVYLKLENTADLIDNPEHRQIIIDAFNEQGGWAEFNEDVMEDRDSPNYDPAIDDIWEISDYVMDVLQEKGFDSVRQSEDVGDNAYLVVGVFDPANIRSVNAAFDPAQAGSSNLLAQGQDSTGAAGSITQQDVEDYIKYRSTGDAVKDSAIRRATHEQFARAWEQYLMEGKAPTIELQNAFRVFARWMTQLYNTLRGRLDNNLDDEMRQVFDRLIATEEQIEIAMARDKFAPLFTDAAMAGKTEEEFAAYKEKVAKVKDEAAETLRIKLINEITRTQQLWWRQEKADVTDDEKERLSEQPIYLAIERLTNGQFKMDRETVKEMVGEDRTNKRGVKSRVVPQKLLAMTVPGAEGVTPDDAAAFFGFSTGEEFIQTLLGTPTLTEAAEAAAEQVMLDRHGDIMNDGTIAQMADLALQNEQKAELLLTELRMLRSGPKKQSVDRAVMEQMAEDRIARLNYTQMFPEKYRKAEIRAAQEAAVALSQGDTEAAAQAKMRQLLNYFLARKATDAKAKTVATVDFMARYNKKSIRQRIMRAENGYMEQIDKILGRFEFRKSKSMKSVDTKNESLQSWAEKRTATEGDALALHPAVLDELYSVHWKKVKFSDLQGIHNSVKNIEHVAKYLDKITLLEDQRNFAELVDQVVTHLDEQPTVYSAQRTTVNEERKTVRWAMAQMSKMPWVMTMLDGGERAGFMHRLIMQPMNEAYNQSMELWKEVGAPVMELLQQRSPEDKKRHLKKLLIPEIKDAKNDGVLMGHQVLAVALNVGNRSNLRKMLLGEGWARPDVEEDITLNNPKLQAVLAYMTESDWILVQKIWDQMDTLYPMLAEVHRKTTGLTPPKVEAAPIQTKWGEFRGGYYPVKYDPYRSQRGEESQEKADNETDSMFAGGASLQQQVTAGATNERTGFYDPIRLSLDVVHNHFHETIQYISFHDAVRQINRLFRNKPVADAIKRVIGPEEFAQFKPWLNDIAKEGREGRTKNEWERAFGKLRFGVTLGVMGFKASTGLMQLLGIYNTAGEVGPKHVYKALRNIIGSPDTMKAAWQFAVDNSKVMNHRAKTMDREINSAMKVIEGKSGFKAAVQEASMKHIAYIQTYLVDLPTWHAAYSKGMEQWGDEQRAFRYADWAVENIQGSGATKDMASLMRNQSEAFRMFTMFMTFFSSLWNMERDLVQGARAGRYSVTSVAAKAMFYFVLPVLTEELMRNGLPDDDDDDSYVQKMLLATATYPAQSVPVLRDMVNGSLGEYRYNPSPVLGVIEQGIRTIPEMAARGFTDEEITKGQWKGGTKFVGAALGIPGVNQAWSTGEHLYQVMKEGEDLALQRMLYGPER